MSRVASFILVAALGATGCARSPAEVAPAADLAPAAAAVDAGERPPEPLEVRFLGVAGFLLQSGDQAVLTAPLFTRPSGFDVTVGTIASDPALVLAGLPAGALPPLRAIVSGHAHYDHLLDTPEVLRAAPAARLYSNASAQHLLAALAPDRAARCNGTAAPAFTIDRARVVAFDDPAASRVDYRPCESLRPAGAPLEGSWVRVPGSRIRLYAICSAHPDQVGPYHFGPGDVDEEQCELPASGGEWREGRTLGILIDFLDENDRPTYRVYYQDAPTTVPVGLPPDDILAGKRIDVALLCVGNYDRVTDAPAATLRALAPRFALGGHWEDFFRPADMPPEPLPFTDVAHWTTQAQATLPVAGEPNMWRSGGQPLTERARLPGPGDRFSVTATP